MKRSYPPPITRQISFTVGDGTNDIAVGQGAICHIDFAGTIVGAYLGSVDAALAAVNATITFDVWLASGAIPTSGGKISASAPITLSGASYGTTSASTWTQKVEAGDVLAIVCASFTAGKQVFGAIRITPTQD